VFEEANLMSNRYASMVGLIENTPVGIVADKIEESGRLKAASRLRNGLISDETIFLKEELGPNFYTFNAIYGESFGIYEKRKWFLFKYDYQIAIVTGQNKVIRLYEHDLFEKFKLIYPNYQIILSTKN
jgi:hypothetical protein